VGASPVVKDREFGANDGSGFQVGSETAKSTIAGTHRFERQAMAFSGLSPRFRRRSSWTGVAAEIFNGGQRSRCARCWGVDGADVVRHR